MEAKKPAIYNRIIFLIVVPVIFMTIIIASLLIRYLSPPIDTFLRHQFDANLQLASNMGLRICQSSFNYLLELRLEDNVEMNRALKTEVLEEIKSLSDQVPEIHLLVIDGDRVAQIWSLDTPLKHWQIPDLELKNDALINFDINGDAVKAYTLFFPFWDWHIVSFVFEKDYLSPIRKSHNIIYFSMIGIFATVFITLLCVYFLFINKPLQQLISATQDIAHGKYTTIPKVTDNEIGQLMTAFNSMVTSLDSEKAEVSNLINQLSVSESQLRTLYDNAPLGICITTKEGSILRTNPSMQKIVGLGNDELQALNFSDLFEKSTDGQNILADIVQEQTIDNFETVLRHNDGSSFPVRMVLTMISVDQQQAIFAIIENVTEKKKLENQLIQARKLEAVGSLAGGVAHDFNNLLTPILGYSELLLINLDQQDRDFKAVKAIWDAAEKARDIIRQLLAFSRKQTLEFKSVDLNIVISDFYSLLQRTVREDIIIKKVLAESLPFINADPGQIEQILMNLAVNAQDAMPKGGRLTIETIETELDAAYANKQKSVLPGTYVMLAVSDTGQGMDAATLEHIFDPFFTTKETGGGTGFGLATVYGIVKQHSGNISVYSEVGQGTTFKIYFPVAGIKIEHPAEKNDQYLSKKPATETILVVEDDESVLKMAITILESQHYKILSATNASDAIRLASQYTDQIHLLLTDVIMPEMNGKELSARIAECFPDIKVIYMSGYTSNVISHHGILDQGIVFIQKPFSVSNLISKVQQVLKGPKV